MHKRVAIIDIGTLKTKFLIAQFDTQLQPHILYKDKQLTVLGKDLEKTNGYITKESITIQIKTLRTYMKIMSQYGVTSYRVIGTESLRKAKNAREVANMIENIIHVPLEILSHEDEARIYFYAISHDLQNTHIAVADIGGGSIQLIIGKDKQIESIHLLKTGVYVLQNTYGKSHHPTFKNQQRAWNHVQAEVAKLHIQKQQDVKFVYGSSDVIDFFTETCIHMSKERFSLQHPYKAKVSELMRLYHKLMPYTYEERMQFFPSEPYFMWGADKGIMNVITLCEALGVDEVIPSNMNISDGLLLTLAE